MDRWTEHFNTLLNTSYPTQRDTLADLPCLPTVTDLDSSPCFTEVQKAIIGLKNKRPGLDGIPGEILKLGRYLLTHRSIPQDWKDAKIIIIFKHKGEKADCSNSNGISLLAVAGKVLARIMLGWLGSRVFRNRGLTISTKAAVYKAVCLSTLLYGSETWTPYQAFHIRCLHRILVRDDKLLSVWCKTSSDHLWLQLQSLSLYLSLPRLSLSLSVSLPLSHSFCISPSPCISLTLSLLLSLSISLCVYSSLALYLSPSLSLSISFSINIYRSRSLSLSLPLYL